MGNYQDLISREWLTLTQVAQGAGLSPEAAQNLIGIFSEVVSGRNFGDIMKYPPQMVELFQIIRDYQDQNYSLEEIKLMIPDRCKVSPRPADLWVNLLHEISSLQENHKDLYDHLQSCFQWMTDILGDMKVVMEKMLNLEEENRTLKLKVVQQ